MDITFRQWTYRHIYLKTPYWHWVRRLIGKRANWTCQQVSCHEVAYNLDVHHTTYAILWMEWLFPWEMVYLCRAHHLMTHGGQKLILKGGKILPPFRYK